eukprot:2298318-Rhodomonas_salina.1
MAAPVPTILRTTVWLARHDGTANTLLSNIADFRIYDRALSASEVAGVHLGTALFNSDILDLIASNQIGCYLVSYTTASMQCQPCPEDTWCTHGVSTDCTPGSSAATGSNAKQD